MRLLPAIASTSVGYGIIHCSLVCATPPGRCKAHRVFFNSSIIVVFSSSSQVTSPWSATAPTLVLRYPLILQDPWPGITVPYSPYSEPPLLVRIFSVLLMVVNHQHPLFSDDQAPPNLPLYRLPWLLNLRICDTKTLASPPLTHLTHVYLQPLKLPNSFPIHKFICFSYFYLQA